MSEGFLIEADTRWSARPMVTQALEQLLPNEWARLDYWSWTAARLGDIHTRSPEGAGHRAVISPRPRTSRSSTRARASDVREGGIPILGLVETWRSRVLECGHAEHIFGSGAGEGCKDYGVEFWGSLPSNPQASRPIGQAHCVSDPRADASIYRDIAQGVRAHAAAVDRSASSQDRHQKLTRAGEATGGS